MEITLDNERQDLQWFNTLALSQEWYGIQVSYADYVTTVRAYHSKLLHIITMHAGTV